MLKLRALQDSDVLMIETWLHREHVKRWYEIPHMGVTIDDWMSEINARDAEFNWLNYRIIMCDGSPIGLCQYYKCEDSDDEDFGSIPITGSYGIDYFIGEEAYLGRGYGKQMIALLIEEIMTLPHVERITADIDSENKASANALLSCGFTLVDTEQSRYVRECK